MHHTRGNFQQKHRPKTRKKRLKRHMWRNASLSPSPPSTPTRETRRAWASPQHRRRHVCACDHTYDSYWAAHDRFIALSSKRKMTPFSPRTSSSSQLAFGQKKRASLRRDDITSFSLFPSFFALSSASNGARARSSTSDKRLYCCRVEDESPLPFFSSQFRMTHSPLVR